MARAASKQDALDELDKQLLRYEIRDRDAKQADSERQWLADTIKHFMSGRVGHGQIRMLAALIQAAHMAAIKSNE